MHMALSPATLPLGCSPPGVPGEAPHATGNYRQPRRSAREGQPADSTQHAAAGEAGERYSILMTKCTLSNGSVPEAL